MLNLIKMDLYRLVRTMSFWVMLVVTVAVAVFGVAMASIDMGMMLDEQQSYSETAEDNPSENSEIDAEDEMNIGVTVETKEEWLDNDIELADFLQVIMGSGMLLIISSIFVAIFVNAEQKNGYIKNIAGQLPMRGLLGVSKLAGVAVQVLTVFIMYTIGTVIAAQIWFGDKLVMGDISELLKFIGVQFILHFAFCTFVAMLCTVSRSAVLGMVVGILINSGLTIFLYEGINKLLNKISILEDFDISKYALESNVYAVTSSSGSDIIIKAIVTGAIYFIICAAISMAVVQKRDIR